MNCRHNEMDMDWSTFLGKSDLTWPDGVGATWGECAFIANGLTGASIYCTQDDEWTLGWELGRTDVAAHHHIKGIDWSVPRVFIGKLLIKPAGKVKSSSMQLRLWDAEATGTVETDRGRIVWRSFIERSSNVIVLEIETTGEEGQCELSMREQWGISPRIPHTDTDPETLADEDLPPKPYRERHGDITVVIQPLTEQGAHATAFCIDELVPNRKVMYASIGKQFSAETPRDDDILKAKAEALRAVSEAKLTGIDSLTEAHRKWWHDYYPQASVMIPDDRDWEKFYWVQIYKFGCASRPDYPIIIDNMGPWFTNCGWPGTWWNLNVQLSYYPTFSANRLEAGRSMINAINHFYATGSMELRETPGAITMGRTASIDGVGGSTDELGNLTWALHNYWRFWKYSMEVQVAIDLFALLKANMQYYFSVMTELDGKIHLPEGVSPEYNNMNEPLADLSYSHQLFRWALQTLLDLDAQFDFCDLARSRWERVLSKLIDLPTNENGLMVAADQGFDKSHRHYSHLLALYPLHTINPEQGRAEGDLFRTSLKRWCSMEDAWAGYSCTGSSTMYSVLGDGNRALEQLNKIWIHGKLQPNTMYAEGGGPVIETPLSVVETIDYMLLQSWGDILRVFPAVPDKWQNVEFRDLRAEGAFLISARREEGKTVWLRIRSEAGLPCCFVVDMDGFHVVSGKQPIPAPSVPVRYGTAWQVDLKKGEEVILSV